MGLVLIRLLVPSMPSSSWSLLNIVPQYQQMAMGQLIDEIGRENGQSHLILNDNDMAPI